MKSLRTLVVFSVLVLGASHAEESQWYRGNTHTHSLWSDGNDFPEMIMDWYQTHDYDFISLSDHNVLATTTRWMSLEAVQKRQRVLGRSAFDKYLARFGEDWVETRDVEGTTEVRLKKLAEYRPLFEKPGEFLILQAEEISNSAEGKPVHINAVNIPGVEPIPAIKEGMTVREIIRANLRAAAELEEDTGQPILVHLNHPNFQWGVTAKDLAHAVEETFFEVYNGHPGIRHLGDEEHPSDERIWDIANAIRLRDLQAAPLFGMATDDSHNYHGGPVGPGRGWVMVKAPSLDGDELVRAMRRGDFYASSGVFVDEFSYDAKARQFSFSIQAEPGVVYTSQLVGTRKGFDLGAKEDHGVGIVLAERQETEVQFTIPETVLYGRVMITADRDHPYPSFENQKEQAWLQPVGWR